MMGDDAHNERSAGLGSALDRLSIARERRGPVGVVDPFQLHDGSRHTVVELPRVAQRRGLFSFSTRARAAVGSYVDIDDLEFDRDGADQRS